MKKLLSLLALLVLSVLPLACGSRALTQPVNPAIGEATPTPTPTYVYYSYSITPTATP